MSPLIVSLPTLSRLFGLCISVSFAWLLSRPGLASVIAGAPRPEQVRDNAAAADLTLPDDAIPAIDALFAPRPE